MDGKWIAAELERAGKNQSELARALSLHPSQVNKMIKGRRRITASEGDAIRAFLHISRPGELPVLRTKTNRDDNVAGQFSVALQAVEVLGDAVPVFWNRAGNNGMLHIERRTVSVVPRTEYLRYSKYAFGLEVMSDFMAPVFERRDVLIINPDRAVVPGDDVLIVQGYELAGQGPFSGHLCRLLAETPDHWSVRQYTPAREFQLAKGEWPVALHITGKRSR